MMRLLLVALLLMAFPAAADTLKVLTGGAFKPVVMDMLADFEKATGHQVTVQNDTAGALSQRLRNGEAFDIVILPTGNLASLATEGRVVGDSIKPFGKVGVGVAVASAAPQPDIGSVEGLRRTLLAARAVAYIDPASGGTSGIYVAKMFERLGIAAEMKPKSVLVRGGLSAEKVANGEAEIALQQASELYLVPSVRVAGMLPAEVQNWTVYAGALSPATQSREAALKLMAALADRGLEPILKKRGLEVP